jgi:hypothetical protein
VLHAGGASSKVQAALGLAAIGAWVMGGAKVALQEIAKALNHTTSPRLTSTWFSSTYWRMAGLAAILTLPFLFAAAVQALLRSDLALLTRAAFGYLPLALLAVGLAAPLTMLLLAATDQMCRVVSSAAGDAGTRFLIHAALAAGPVSILDGSAFLAFLIGLFAALGALVLWLELLIREAAVYVIVLMMPLAFAAFVWPARRVWATRAVELLVALILSKFAIVAVLSLGGSALAQSPFTGVTSVLVGLVLVTLGAFAPWAMLRLIPLAEIASGAAASLHGESWRLRSAGAVADSLAHRATAGRADGNEDGPNFDVEREPTHAARAETERLADLKELPQSAAVAVGGGSNGHGPHKADDQDVAERQQETHDSAGNGDSSGERIPGLGPAFQMKDNTWRPIVLGLDEGWPPDLGVPDGSPPDLGVPDGSPPDLGVPDGSPPAGPKQSVPGESPPESPASEQDSPALHDDRDGLPPEQEPEDGRL